MKKAKRFLAIFLAVIMAFAAVPLTASAASIFSTAKSISSGNEITTELYSYSDTADFKITAAKEGKLFLSINADFAKYTLELFDTYGNKQKIIDVSITSGKVASTSTGLKDGGKGKDHIGVFWNTTTENSKALITYKVSKGTYYIRFTRGSDTGNDSIKFTATSPTNDVKSKISYLSLTMSKGWSLQLGAVVSPTNSKVTWKSSKSSVVSVSSKGVITAKKAGTAIITAKSGTSTKKIKIIVK